MITIIRSCKKSLYMFAQIYSFCSNLYALSSFPQDEAIENEYYVRILYNNKEVVLPACGSALCPLSTFMALMQQYQIKDWEKACVVSESTEKKAAPQPLV